MINRNTVEYKLYYIQLNTPIHAELANSTWQILKHKQTNRGYTDAICVGCSVPAKAIQLLLSLGASSKQRITNWRGTNGNHGVAKNETHRYGTLQ